MADNAARSETSMYCHACHYQWERQGENIECPSCHSASTEIVCGSPDTFLFLTDLEFGLGLTSFDQITPENDPNQFYNRQPDQPITSDSTPNAAPAPAADPAATQTAPQPEQHSNQTTENSTQNSGQPSGNGQVPHSTVQFTVFNLPISGMAFFTTRPIASPASAAGQAEPQPHQTQQAEQPQQPQQAPSAPMFHMPPVIHLSFPIIMHGLPPRRPQTSEAPQQQAQQETRQAAVEPQQNNGEQPPVNAEQPQLNGDQQHPSPQPPSAEARDPRRTVAEANMIEALLSMLFNPVNAVLGNAVYSQEAFDHILSQLREQTPAGGAPPASQAAIGKLALRELEHESKCVVCVEDMPKGEKVAVLPCNHSFHGECVTPWLKLHNTCPVCRRSIEVEETDTVKKAPPVVFGPAPPPGMTQAQQHNGDAMDCS